MKILVTGGAGFIGGNFIYYLLEKHQNDDGNSGEVVVYYSK